MKNGSIHIVPLTPALFEPYIDVGTTSYCQHYLHLWNNRDPSPYIKQAFRPEVVKKEWEDPGISLYLIYVETLPVGILKIILDTPVNKDKRINCLFLERIYLLAEYTGQGIGKAALEFAESLGREKGQKYLCLETMKKGPALDFYQNNGYKILGTKALDFNGLVPEERPMFILGKEL